jgi:hypothetical protein
VRITYPVDALVSYHYYKRDDLMAAVTGPGHLRLVGDSGAYSAWAQGQEIRLPEYAAWCRQWGKHLAWVAALDVIGDPQATWVNWAAFRDVYGIRSVPTVHAGTPVKWLDVYAAEGVDFIGLGGLVGGGIRGFKWMVHVLQYAAGHHPQLRFHAWGVTTRKVLDALPLYSADSSGIMGTAYRYARLRTFNPATGRDVMIHLDGTEPYRHRLLLERVYGVTPQEVERSTPANRPLLIAMAAASTQRYAEWLQARHGVSPPTWGLTGPDLGPRIHLVDAAAGHGTTTDLVRLNGPRIHLADAGPPFRQRAEGVERREGEDG